MAFASIYVPNFMVQAVVRAEPSLGGSGIALVDGISPVWNVVAVNEGAARAGIELGMAKSQATQFCGIQIRQRSRMQEESAHAALLDLGWSISPRVEDTAADTLVLDLAGLDSLFGSEEKISRQIVERARAMGLAVNVAVAASIDAACHAARGFSGITFIPAGAESKTLGTLPVSVLSPPAEILEILDRWGVRTCAALAALPVLELSERLGQYGVRLQEWARGSSARSMVLAESGTIFEEAMEAEYGIAELEPLAFLLGRLLDQLCTRLATRSLAICAIRLQFELEISREAKSRGENGDVPDSAALTGARNYAQNAASQDGKNKHVPKVFEKVLRLPVPMRDSKMLLRLLRLQLQADPPPAPILRIVMSADPAVPRVAQGGLFMPASPDPEKLELTLARLAHLVGDSNVGTAELTDTHRPGDFRMSRFIPPREKTFAKLNGKTRDKSGEGALNKSRIKLQETAANHWPMTGQAAAPDMAPDMTPDMASDKTPGKTPDEKFEERRTGRARVAKLSGAKSNSGKSGEAKSGGANDDGVNEQDPWTRKPAAGFRIFRPAPAARVELKQGHPVRVWFQGLCGEVIAASGPWCTTGDWWREDAWKQEEWDLEIRFVSAKTETRSAAGREAQVLNLFSKRGLTFPDGPNSSGNSLGKNTGKNLRNNTGNNTRKTGNNLDKNAGNNAPYNAGNKLVGLYRIYYDSVRRAWFVRGVYD